jgi:hypothetical protein
MLPGDGDAATLCAEGLDTLKTPFHVLAVGVDTTTELSNAK